MNSKIDSNQLIMEGFESLQNYWKRNKLTFLQRLQIHLLVFLVFILKFTLKPLRLLVGKKFEATKGFEKCYNEKISCIGNKTQESDGGFYMTKKEKQDFEETGVYGPFKIFEPEEATNLAQYSHDLLASKYGGQIPIGQKIADILEESGKANMNYLGMFQALNWKRLWNAFTKEELTHKLASVLGDDLLLWRSQFFHKPSGAEGTFWHQTGSFRETSKQEKLTPPPNRQTAIIGLSVWIALTESNKENGCLRLIKGSYSDSRFEKFAYNIVEDKIGFLLDQPIRELESILKTLFFSSGNFQKVQMVYDYAQKYVPDLFKNIEIFDLEMKPGEAVIFTSLNTHGSYPNTSNYERLALAGRITPNDVKVYNNMKTDVFNTPKGIFDFSLEPIKCIQIIGKDKFGFNRIAKKPLDS